MSSWVVVASIVFAGVPLSIAAVVDFIVRRQLRRLDRMRARWETPPRGIEPTP